VPHSSAWQGAFVDAIGSIVLQFLERVSGPFLTAGSVFSLTSLGCALLIAVAYIAVRLRRRRRRLRARVILRALFPRRLAGASTGVDISYLVFNVFIFGAIFGWAAISFRSVSHGTFDVLSGMFGTRPESGLPEIASRSLVTLALFLAYELGYWLHHYLCHRVQFLWEFHKVHHTANVLTPLTVFRVHPVDTWLFVNVLALFVGVASGASNYALGTAVPPYAVTDTNLILVVFIHLYIHFQHSHLWVAFRGGVGRVLLSPAHHQVHHSNNPVHFNKNLGSCLAVWDWLFGTLYVPARTPERLTFGVEADGRDAQTISEAYLASFSRAARVLRRSAAQASATSVGDAVPDDEFAATGGDLRGFVAPSAPPVLAR
jgi:sterol desaturase/sphingolipid hydroxylase (fatty acid hydroxylase superfamily)